MRLTVTDDEGKTLHFPAITLDVAAEVWHALSGSPSVPYSAHTGACLCTSFSQRLTDGDCNACGHAAHNTRVHCGAMAR